MKFDDSLIPEGHYCYKVIGRGNAGRLKTQLCPYWVRTTSGLIICLRTMTIELDDGKSSEEIAFRRYGRQGLDALLNDEPPSLLWDQVKECGINENFDDEDGHECHSCGKCSC